MGEYEHKIEETRNFSLSKLIEICRGMLPSQYANRPYTHPELSNGVALLHSEEGMNAYIAAYGEMHQAKCRAALQNFPFDDITGSVEIVDWGCGQGLGSLCVIEALNQHDKLNWLKRVTLVEPCGETLSRAAVNVEKATNGCVFINSVNEYMPPTEKDGNEDCLDEISYFYHYVIHVFSNILDVPGIDLCRLAQLTSVSGHQHYILCMGPVNRNSFRIDQFCSIFGKQELFSDISDKTYGRTSDTYYTFTCKTKCFRYDGRSLDYSHVKSIAAKSLPFKYENEYDPQMAVENGTISQALCDVYKMFVRLTNENDIIVIKPDIKGDKPDLIIVRPHTGILVLKIFEDDLGKYNLYADSDGNSVDDTKLVDSFGNEVDSPLFTVWTYWDDIISRHIDGLMEKAIKDRRNWGVVKKMVFFASNTTAEALDFFKDKKDKYIILLGKDILSDTGKQQILLHEARFDNYNNVFDEVMMRKFMRIISPEWHSYKEGQYVNLTTPQKNLVKSISGKKQKISGVAGAGKTQVLATRAVNAQVRTGGDILILTFNIALANYMRYRIGEVKADFPWNKLTITYYHRFFRSMANRIGRHVSLSSYENEGFFEKTDPNLPKYDAIFIDEVQDYKEEWLRILNDNFLKDKGEFVVFGDPKQNVYKRPLDNNGDIRIGAVITGQWNHTLKDGMRFSNPQLARLAFQFQLVFLSKEHPEGISTPPVLDQSLLVSIKYANIGLADDMNKLARYCRGIFRKFNINPKDSVVLAQMGDILRVVDYNYRQMTAQRTTTTFMKKESYDELLAKYHIDTEKDSTINYAFKRDKEAIEHGLKERFTMDTNNLKLSTIHSFKGWEAPTVILFIESEEGDLQKFKVPSNLDNPELIYTAITRARENLYIINLGNKKYDDFFKNHIHN